jgi:hypothetical protein
VILFDFFFFEIFLVGNYPIQTRECSEHLNWMVETILLVGQGKLTAPLSANVNVLSATPRLLVPC